MADIWRKLGVSEQTVHTWRENYAGMDVLETTGATPACLGWAAQERGLRKTITVDNG